MIEGLLPIGSVVLVGNSIRKVMIIGVCQKGGKENKIFDYSAVIYPEGFLDPEKLFLFNNDQISKIYSYGYQDDDQFEFKKKIDVAIKQLREN